MNNHIPNQVNDETLAVTYPSQEDSLGIAGTTTLARPLVADNVTKAVWIYDFGKTSSSAAPAQFMIDSFQVAPNKVSPHDKVWDEVERLLAEWYATDAAIDMDDEWLNDLRASSDRRLNDLYGPENWE